jgi:hypothetical protein
MAKMKWEDDIDWRGLDAEEYDEDSSFDEYDGPTPPANTLLDGDIKKIWLAESSTGNMMFKVLFEAADNEGDNKEYDGCPIWDNVVFTSPGAKFRWQPWFNALGISLKDVKTKTIVGEEDSVGTVVEKIGKVDFTEGVPIRVRTSVEKKGEYKGQVRVGKWLPAADEDDEEIEDGDEPF